MIIANAFLTSACIFQYNSAMNAGVHVPFGLQLIYWIWIGLFSLLTLISLYKLIKSPTPTKEGGSFGLALLSVPLYAYMAISTGISFTFLMNYPMGQAIYLGRYVAQADTCC
jgi:hypothetical protein